MAIYGGGRVQRYAPDGALREELHVPARETTSCAFAGSGLHRLYVTTATENWTDEQRRAEPTAGLVYRFDTDATGRPAEPFRPDPPGGGPSSRNAGSRPGARAAPPVRVPSVDDAELRGTRWNSRVAGAGEGEDGGLVGGEPGDEALLVDVIGEEEHLVAEAQSADVRVHDARRATALLRRCETSTSAR